ncbi:tyrosine-protein phosphatase [Micromonospora sp. NPDC049679]|uniref:tyrosine-protein phosphatase n=1 Tax=Micromonospora sp. NPDC049679 TaxID=3155920 RepID=UPI0033EE4A33
MDVSPATRTLTFSTLFNFRDVGGYAGLDGRTVRWRRVYRSDSLHRIDDSDRAAFAALGVRTVIDLRRPHEVSRYGRVPAYDGLDYQHVHLEHQEWIEIPYEEEVGPARYLADRYHDLAEQAAGGVVDALTLIADEASAPAVVHCAAGKDRTGVVCALTLSLLGVPDEVIAEDYALSTAAADRFTAWLDKQDPYRTVPTPFFSSPAEAMQTFLGELRQRHGSIERYVTGAGLGREQVAALRAHLLTDPTP